MHAATIQSIINVGHYIKNVIISRVNKKEKRVSNCLNTVYRVLRSLDILPYSCYDNTLSLSSTKYIMQVYFVLCKQCLHTGIQEFDTLFSFLSTLDYIDIKSPHYQYLHLPV